MFVLFLRRKISRTFFNGYMFPVRHKIRDFMLLTGCLMH